MNESFDQLIQQWKEKNEPSAERLEAIRRDIVADNTLSLEWWKSVLWVPRTVFFKRVA